MKHFLVLFLCIIFQYKGNFDDCLKKISNRVQGNLKYQELRADINYLDSIIVFNYNNEKEVIKKQVDSFYNYLNLVDNDEINFFKVENKRYSFFALVSRIKKSTGLMSNFWQWFLFSKDGTISHKFISLSNNPKFIFLQKNKIIYYKFAYSDNFIHNKNWDDVTYSVTKNIIKNNSKIERIRKIKCK